MDIASHHDLADAAEPTLRPFRRQNPQRHRLRSSSPTQPSGDHGSLELAALHSAGVASNPATSRKRRRSTFLVASCQSANPFDLLCDDLVLSILAALSSRARSPSHLIAAALTCKRFRKLAMHRTVLANVTRQAVAVRASSWCNGAHDFLRQCADAGNSEACFTLGMIKFYCMGDRREGVRLLAKAATAWHGAALFAMAIMQFNGSGGKPTDKNAGVGVALLVRAAQAGSVEAMRELGHCFNEGQGLPRDTMAGRHLLLDANRKEAVQFVNARGGCTRDGCIGEVGAVGAGGAQGRRRGGWKDLLRRSLLSDYGCALPLRWLVQDAHPAHLFLAEWFARQPVSERGLLRVCSHALCGRAESRPLEFRQCAVCSSVFYCSRSCQSMDWKLRHMLMCHRTLPSLI